MTQIIQTISNHPVLGKLRAIRVKQIGDINFDNHYAFVRWEEVFLDSEENPIFEETVANREITSEISNNNTVNENRIVIDSANFPKLESETDEEYRASIS